LEGLWKFCRLITQERLKKQETREAVGDIHDFN
jgi:hypothetical protein